MSSCASRQLEEVTFRRTVIPVQELLDAAGKYFKKLMKNLLGEDRIGNRVDGGEGDRRRESVAFSIGKFD